MLFKDGHVGSRVQRGESSSVRIYLVVVGYVNNVARLLRCVEYALANDLSRGALVEVFPESGVVRARSYGKFGLYVNDAYASEKGLVVS